MLEMISYLLNDFFHLSFFTCSHFMRFSKDRDLILYPIMLARISHVISVSDGVIKASCNVFISLLYTFFSYHLRLKQKIITIFIKLIIQTWSRL